MIGRTVVRLEDGTILHEGPSATTDYDRACADVARRAVERVSTAYGPGVVYEDNSLRVFVDNPRRRAVR